jgi:hypothetical protein
MATIIFRGGGAYNCGTVVHARGNVTIDSEGFEMVNCGRGFDVSDDAQPQQKPEPEKQTEVHQTPAGILALHVAGMLSGTAIGRAIGVL